MAHGTFHRRVLIGLCGLLYFAAATTLSAQQSAAPAAGAASGASHQGLYLVFPFENAGASPRLDWLGEGLEELTIQYLADAGEQVYSHAGRAGELERYGLPSSAKLSRATMLRIAQDLDADYVVFGSFTSDGTTLNVESRVLRVDPPALLPAVRNSGPLSSLMELHTDIVWHLLSLNERASPLSFKEFAKAQRQWRLDAFEHFVRGLLANEDDARIRELRQAASLEPSWPDPAFALGETYAARNDCDSALPWFARVPKTHQRYVEAVFDAGVCRLQLNQPDKAEEAFTALQASLRDSSKHAPDAVSMVSGADLPEILNDRGIALARQGKTAAAQADLRRATDLDPDEDDYPFNLGLVALRANEFSAAAGYFREASEREPDNAEDRAMLVQALEKAGKNAEADEERVAASEALGPNALPAVHIESQTNAKSDAKAEGKADPYSRIDRIKTQLDITALRLEISPGNSLAAPASPSASVAALTPGGHIRRARQELSAGQLDSAETEFRAALLADPANASAHEGLGEVNRRRGKLDDAAKELQASLAARDSAFVHTLLARIYLEQKKFDLARTELERALKLAPNYADAKQLLDHLQSSKPNGGGQ